MTRSILRVVTPKDADDSRLVVEINAVLSHQQVQHEINKRNGRSERSGYATRKCGNTSGKPLQVLFAEHLVGQLGR